MLLLGEAVGVKDPDMWAIVIVFWIFVDVSVFICVVARGKPTQSGVCVRHLQGGGVEQPAAKRPHHLQAERPMRLLGYETRYGRDEHFGCNVVEPPQAAGERASKSPMDVSNANLEVELLRAHYMSELRRV